MIVTHAGQRALSGIGPAPVELVDDQDRRYPFGWVTYHDDDPATISGWFDVMQPIIIVKLVVHLPVGEVEVPVTARAVLAGQVVDIAAASFTMSEP